MYVDDPEVLLERLERERSVFSYWPLGGEESALGVPAVPCTSAPGCLWATGRGPFQGRLPSVPAGWDEVPTQPSRLRAKAL